MSFLRRLFGASPAPVAEQSVGGRPETRPDLGPEPGFEGGRSRRTRATFRGGSDDQPIYGVFLDGIPDPYETGRH